MTALLMVALALVISSALLLGKPVVAPEAATQTSAATCYTSSWRYVADEHGSVNWRIKVSYEYRLLSNCKVEIRSVRCSSWSVLAGFSGQKCSAWYDAYQLSGNVRTTARACSVGDWGICVDVQLWHKVTYNGWYVYREGIY